MDTGEKLNTILGDLSNLHFGGQEQAVEIYIQSLLFGELKDYLSEKGVKVFKGISREFTKHYMRDFNEMLKLNNYTRGPMDLAFEVEYEGEPAYKYTAFFVFQNSRGNAFGSFPAAYKFANEMYLFNHMILGNATLQLAENSQVQFGQVVVQDGDMKEKDLEKVVNTDFYKSLIKS